MEAKVVLKIKDVEIALTVDELRELALILSTLTPKEDENTPYIPWPIYVERPWRYWEPVWTTATDGVEPRNVPYITYCGGNNENV